jgi:ankyrin repeat protein
MKKNLLLTFLLFLSTASVTYADILRAAYSGDLQEIKKLVQNGVDVNTQDKYGNSALMQASKYSYLDVVKYLVQKGAHTKNALQEAAYHGHFEIVKYLVKNGVDADEGVQNAVTQGHTDMVKYLLEKGAKVNAKRNDASVNSIKAGTTLLIDAAEKGHTDIVKYLIAKGADVNAQDNKKKTALIKAASEGHLDVIKVLMEKGADIHAKDKDGNTPLMSICFTIAYQTNNIDIMAYGGDLSPIQNLEPKYLAVVQYLVEHGADINAKNTANATPMSLVDHPASFGGRHQAIRFETVIKYLKEKGAKK